MIGWRWSFDSTAFMTFTFLNVQVVEIKPYNGLMLEILPHPALYMYIYFPSSYLTVIGINKIALMFAK